jgi:hypothetical protein
MMAKAKQQPAQFSFGLVITDPEQHLIVSRRKARKCLSCSSDFASDGPGNRICGACKSLDIWTSPAEFTVAASF